MVVSVEVFPENHHLVINFFELKFEIDELCILLRLLFDYCCLNLFDLLIKLFDVAKLLQGLFAPLHELT